MILRTVTAEPKRHVDEAIKQAVAQWLITIRDRGIPIRSYAERLALEHGVDRSTVYRWVNDEDARRAGKVKATRPRMVTDDMMIVFARCGGKLAATYRACVERGLIDPGVHQRTFQRHFLEDVDSILVEGVRMNDADARLLGLYLTYTAESRNAQWQLDTFEFPLLLDDGGPDPVKARSTAYISDRTRYVPGQALHIGPANAHVVLAATVDAVRPKTATFVDSAGRDRSTVVGGRPLLVLHDNASEMLSDLALTAFVDFGIVSMPTPPRMPTAKGKIEAFARTAQEVATEFMGWLDGPTSRFLQPYFVPKGRDGLLTTDQFEQLWFEWLDFYNRARPHRSLGRITPAEAWAAEDDTDDLVLVAPEILERHLLPARKQLHVVHRTGVRFRERNYIHVALFGVKKVEVRYSTTDESFVDCWVDGRFLCRAKTPRR